MLDKLILAHPREIGESYAEHAGHATWIGIRMILSGFACLVHALLPGLFVRTASNTVDAINELRAARAAAGPVAARVHSETALSATMIEKPSN